MSLNQHILNKEDWNTIINFTYTHSDWLNSSLFFVKEINFWIDDQAKI